jgi:hypothetical protein
VRYTDPELPLSGQRINGKPLKGMNKSVRIIDIFSREDASQYTVFAENAGGSVMSRTIRVIVEYTI